MDGFILGRSEIFLITLKTSNSDLGFNGEIEKYFAFIPNICESVGRHGLRAYGRC